MDLKFLRLQFLLRAGKQPVRFPPGKAANMLRGALGETLRRFDPDLYRQVFAPSAKEGPSGLLQPPRPFVLRAASLDGVQVAAGEYFTFNLHLFLLQPESVRGIIRALAQLHELGLGAQRASVTLESVTALDLQGVAVAPLFQCREFTGGWPPPLILTVLPALTAAPEVDVQFVTPVELKGCRDPRNPEFPTLIARLRDRISTLRAFYGSGPLAIDFAALAARARQVEIRSSNLTPVSVSRRSSRTGQVHALGGLTGQVRYAGPLAEFLPYLFAGQWTGVGRQTVWGKGEIAILHRA